MMCVFRSWASVHKKRHGCDSFSQVQQGPVFSSSTFNTWREGTTGCMFFSQLFLIAEKIAASFMSLVHSIYCLSLGYWEAGSSYTEIHATFASTALYWFILICKLHKMQMSSWGASRRVRWCSCLLSTQSWSLLLWRVILWHCN